jgi:hypothetical protein
MPEISFRNLGIYRFYFNQIVFSNAFRVKSFFLVNNFCKFVIMGYLFCGVLRMDDYIKITVLENTIEAQLIDSILSEKNIPHRIRSFHDTAYDGLFQFQKGWGELYAPLKLKGEILEIIEIVRSE